MEDNKIMKPVSVRIEELKKHLVNAATGAELPFYIVEMVMKEVLQSVSSAACQEYDQGRAEWEKARKEGESDGGYK